MLCMGHLYAIESRRPVYDHGLTPIQVQYKKDEIKKCKAQGKKPSMCKICEKDTMYMYSCFSKRGGTKYLYCCENCFHRESKLIVSEEDYDFLSN